jgi:tetratricopeptide (TPR) repeat protein
LGLLEVSPDESLRVPRILPLTLSTNVETLHEQAAEVLYGLWWKQGETRTEEEVLEIHRLALLGKKGEIASKVGAILASNLKAKSRFREALNLCKETLNIVENYHILHQLARSEEQLGEIEQAKQHYQKALEICPAADAKAKAAIIHNLAGIYANKGEIEDAITLYHQSLQLQKSIGNLQATGATFCEFGRIYAKIGKIEEAIVLYQQTLKLEESIGDVQGQAATLHQLATIYADTGKIEEAIALYQQSLEIAERIGDIHTKAAIFHSLAGIYTNKGEIDKAIAHYQEVLEMDERTGNVEGKSVTLAKFGNLLAYQKGDFVTALDYLHQSLKIFQGIQSPNAETVIGFINDVQQMANG